VNTPIHQAIALFAALAGTSAATYAGFIPPEAQQPIAPPATLAVFQPEAEEVDTVADDTAAEDAVVDEDPLITFSETADPMELTALVDFVANTLGINISVRGELRGTVLFNTSKSVRMSKLLPLLDAMLEQHDFSITYDSESEFYQIQPKGNIPIVFGDDGNPLASTKLIEIPNIKPSALSDSINQILGNAATAGAAGGVTFIDELGLIIITNTPRQIARVEELISKILARTKKMVLTPIELEFISASTARDRLISLAGGSPASSPTNSRVQNPQFRNQNNAQANNIGPAAGGTIENLAERLAVDPQSNSLLFRGTPDELARVQGYVDLIDVDNKLPSKRHFVGSAARQIAELASGRGLGEVVILEDSSSTQNNQFGNARNFQQQSQLGNQQQSTVTGPTLIVDTRNGEIVYYGTIAQQEILEGMIADLDTEADRIVIRHYKLSHAVADEVTEIITTLLNGQQQAQGGLLPQNRGGQNQNQFQQSFNGSDGEIGNFDPRRVFVVADVPNNQIIVKAPIKQQDDLAQLIEKLDLRRRQVYIEAIIVSVSDTETFRFAIEQQYQAGQFGVQSNFSLSDAGADFLSPRVPATGLGGLTASLIQTEYLPFVITAIQNDTDGRIISKPQLLVNDNEEATIASIEQQPTTSQSQGTATTVTTFDGYEDAGTSLTVTPGISEAGFLRLEYVIEFSNFVGLGSNGVPPPRTNQNVEGSVTMPTDTTIVVGGITVENRQNTVIKVPFLGDIPLVGDLFRDTNKNKSNSLLYIFITPKILVDPDFRDLRLLSKGPQFESGLDLDLPELQPIAIERIRPANRTQDPAPTPAEAPSEN